MLGRGLASLELEGTPPIQHKHHTGCMKWSQNWVNVGCWMMGLAYDMASGCVQTSVTAANGEQFVGRQTTTSDLDVESCSPHVTYTSLLMQHSFSPNIHSFVNLSPSQQDIFSKKPFLVTITTRHLFKEIISGIIQDRNLR